MTSGPILFDPELLERYAIIRSSPSWQNVKESMTRLKPLRESDAKPYEQMDLDRDNVRRYAAILQSSASSIFYGVCLAAHLARFSKTEAFAQRLNDGFAALSTGLELPTLGESDTGQELARCAASAFPDLKIEVPALLPPAPAPDAAPAQAEPANPPPEPADQQQAPAEEPAPATQTAAAATEASATPTLDPWSSALQSTLAKIRDMAPLNEGDFTQRASDAWQARLQAFLSAQPEVLPDIDYLRCRAANHPLGTVLRGRLKNASLREWSEAYVRGMYTGVPLPVPLWFALAALAALGFDIPRELTSVTVPTEGEAAAKFISRIPPTSDIPKGLIILRTTAESQTANWQISPSMPTLIVTAEDFFRTDKASLRSYFQPRLYGVLIEVGRDEDHTAALNRVGLNKIRQRFPSARVGFLLAALPQNPTAMGDYGFAVLPGGAYDAYVKAFPPPVTNTKSGSPAS